MPAPRFFGKTCELWVGGRIQFFYLLGTKIRPNFLAAVNQVLLPPDWSPAHTDGLCRTPYGAWPENSPHYAVACDELRDADRTKVYDLFKQHGYAAMQPGKKGLDVPSRLAAESKMLHFVADMLLLAKGFDYLPFPAVEIYL